MDNQEVEPQSPAQLDNAKLELSVGMEFDSFEEAYNFYNSYAGRKGFSVRRAYCHRKKGVKVDQKFVCSKESYREKCKKNVKFHRPATRTGCLACIIVVLQKNGKVQVKKFETQHNHKTVTPQEAHMLRSQRRTTQRRTNDTQVLQENVANVIGITSKHVGGRESLGYLDVGFYNYLHQKRQRMMESGVAGAIAQYFQKMQVSNPSFYFAFQFDAEDMLTNIFWVDAQMILDYKHFGDVVLFNTIYDSPFATFLGVNHHNQTIVFGAALMYDETFDSFIWLFKSFLSAMSGKRPKTIFTNQSTALANAVATSMPDTNHQLSIWHVYQDAIKHLSNVINVTQCFKQDFSKCIQQDEDEEVFCRGWEKMLEDYNLKDNKWLQGLFSERKKWARVYERHVFYANMNTTQRSEAFNAFTPQHPVSQSDLIRFLEQFEGVIGDYQYGELKEDFKARNSTPSLFVPSPMLENVAKVYTPTMFHIFQEQLKLTISQMVKFVKEEGSTRVYSVGNRSTHWHTVTYDSCEFNFQCSCYMFQYLGIQCSHVMKIHNFEKFECIRPQYILKRWTVDAKAGEVKNSHGYLTDVESCTLERKRYANLYDTFVKVSTKAARFEQTYLHVSNVAKKLMYDLEEMSKNLEHGSSVSIDVLSVNPDGLNMES